MLGTDHMDLFEKQRCWWSREAMAWISCIMGSRGGKPKRIL